MAGHSEETRKKISEALKDKKKSEAHKAAISTSQLGKKRGPYGPREKKGS